MRDRLNALWNLKHSSNAGVRLAWHLALLLLVIGPTYAYLRSAIILVIAFLCVLLCGVASVWGAFHLRAVLLVRKTVWRWTLGATVVVLLAVYAGTLDQTTSLTGMSIPTAGFLSLVVFALPILLGLLYLYGWLGAAVSAFVVRRSQDSERLTFFGVTIWWLLTSLYVIAVVGALQRNQAQERSGVTMIDLLCFAIPPLTALICILARITEWDLRLAVERLLHRLARYLTFRRRWRGRPFTVDLRGALLGLLVATTVCGLSRPLLKGASASLLVWMIQVRNQEARGAWNGWHPRDSTPFFVSPLRDQDEGVLTLRRKIVLIDLDPKVLRAAFDPDAVYSQSPQDDTDIASVHSEAALQALLIRRLHALRASVIVLMPSPHQSESATDPKEPKSDTTKVDAEAKRSQHEAKLLADAIKAAGNVVIALPRQVARDEREAYSTAALSAVAAKAGDEQLVSYGSIRLPVLEGGGRSGQLSLPIGIAQEYALRAHIAGSYEFNRRTLIPVDFRNAKPGHDFFHIPASSLLTPEAPDAKPEKLVLTPRGEWQTLEESVHGRIVFLNSPNPHFHETPLGALPAREVLAYGTATALAHERGARVSTSRILLLTLLIGTIMGMLCAHRTPFEAAGRMAAMCALVLFTSLTCYMIWTLWLDAVVPLTAIVLTYLLVTQLAFTQQREKDRDLLKRFVAPEFVDAMLDHPSDRLGLEGKLSHVCVLFADVRNFTGFAERHRPEEVFEAVNQYMTALTNALHTYGGVLDKYTGDGLMAWFPSQTNSRVQIENAVRATLAMRDAALEISQARVAQGKPPLQFGIGMHYGEAMIGLVGNEEHQINYTALGHAVIVSARLQTLAAGGEVIISEAIFTALDSTFQVEAREPVAVKGIYELVRPYLVRSA